MLTTPPDFIKLLAPDIRWQIVNLLKQSDRRVGELAVLLQQPQNLLSYHLKQLRQENLIHYRRSDADRRDYYYSLNINRLQTLYQQAGAELHLGGIIQQDIRSYHWTPPVRVLYLCTRNSARSQMAEGLLRHLAGKNVEVYSAGSEPASVHPLAIQVMDELGIDIRLQQSKHLDAFISQDFHYVVTVCDHVREVCPTFPHTQTIHWSLPDPIATEETARLEAFHQTAKDLADRIQYFMTLIENERES